MADSIRYGMGQLRYSPPFTNYMNDLNFNSIKVKTRILSTSDAESDSDIEYYRDVYLQKEDFSFDIDTSYLLHLDIPRDPSYDCIYQLKMIGTPTNLESGINTAQLDYQMIKYITVPRDTKTSNTNRIILYPVNSNGKPWTSADGSYVTKVAIAKTLNENPDVGDVVFDESTNKYFIFGGPTGNNEYIIDNNSPEIVNKNDTIMEHTWIVSDIKTDIVSFDIIFSPRNTDVTYNGIFIQMQRSSLDYDIYSSEEDTGGTFGRKMNVDEGYKATIYQLNNLIDGLSNIETLNNIGVYSHPNLLMAINGEEIRVGQSGYYELNDFDITSLAIAASGDNDRFTVDYQYKIID